jgi:CubicO group peptidase (beta-lactamase class C family)
MYARHARFLLVLILLLLTFGCWQKGTTEDEIFKHKLKVNKDQFINEIAKEIPDLMKEALIPGLSIAVIRDGKVFWQGGYGVTNINTKKPVESNIVFEAASLSKPVFTYAVLKLVDRQLLNLDKPLIDYIGEEELNQVYPKSKGADERYKSITARIVLTHSTGFPNWINQGLLSFMFDPGEKFSYSGEGFSFLSIVVEKITEKKMNDFIKEEVFEPLGMNNSSYIWLDKYKDLFAGSHNFLGEITPRRRRTAAVAGASLYTTAEDYAKFLVALLNSQDLNRNTHKEMIRPQIDVPARYGDKEKVCEWGLGIGLHNTDQGRTCWHWGDNGDFKSYFEVSLKHKIGVVFFANSANGHAITEKIVQLTTGMNHSAITTDFFIYPAYDSFVLKMLKAYKQGGIDSFKELMSSISDEVIEKELYLKYAFHDLGSYLMNKSRIEDATTVFKKASQIYPKDTGTLIYLAGIAFTTGENRDGLTTLKHALEIDSNLEGQINILGYRLLNAKKFDEAIEVFKFNVKSYPNSANCYDSLGEAYLKKGDEENAKIYYRKALKIDPDFSTAISALKKLEKESRD